MTYEYDVAVVGGGLSGLVAALELAETGHHVIVYEAEDRLGGFATSRGRDQTFDEHSWRSFGSFYTNLEEVTRRLGIPWPTAPVNVKPFPPVPPGITRGDMSLLWTLVKGMWTSDLAPLRRISWCRIQSDLSPQGRLLLGRFNKSGSDYHDIPYATVVRVVEMILPLRSQFFISPTPIQEYLIDPLEQRLRELGVTFRLQTKVTTLSPKALGATYVVSAIPPVAYASLDNTDLFTATIPRMRRLAHETAHQEISFRLFFTTHIHLPEKATFDLHKTPWGLLIMPADAYYYDQQHWSGSVWSGTCTDMRGTDKNGRTPHASSKAQFIESILDQVLGCESLARYAGGSLTLPPISHVNVWKEWVEVGGRLQSAEIMPVNRCAETMTRPRAGCRLGSKVFLAGAHAGTGTEMWLMESAAEAGKRAARAILSYRGLDPSHIFLDPHPRRTKAAHYLTMATALVLVTYLFYKR